VCLGTIVEEALYAATGILQNGGGCGCSNSGWRIGGELDANRGAGTAGDDGSGAGIG
jgi:hypothetical protein